LALSYEYLLGGGMSVTPFLTPAAANGVVTQLSSSGALPYACSSLSRSLWNLVRLSEAGMLDAVLNVLETADVQENELLLASAIHALDLLSAHAITPNQLRKLLALVVARGGLTCSLLRPLVHAAERAKLWQPLGGPSRFLAFDGQAGLAATLPTALLGARSFSNPDPAPS
jgi:hypothetical protein